MKIIKIKMSDANVRKIVKPLEEARELVLSATSQLAVFLGRTKQITGLHEADEAEDYIKDLEASLQSLNKKIAGAKAALKGVGK